MKTDLILIVAFVCLSGAANAGATVTYYYSDPNGTILAEADAAGNIVSTSDYRPYGAQALGAPEAGPGYTGHVNDPDSGLVYMQARYYDSLVGRFVGADPSKMSAGNVFQASRYAYGNNDPIGNVDPDGRDTCPGATALTCIRANSFVAERSAGKTIQMTPDVEKVAVASKDDVRTSTRPEQGGYLIKDSETGAVTLVKSGIPSRDNTHDRLDLGPKPEGAVGVLHSHVDGISKGLQSDGDSQALKLGLPNAVESLGRVGVWEMMAGRLQVRMLDGKMTRTEHDELQKDLDNQQEKFLTH